MKLKNFAGMKQKIQAGMKLKKFSRNETKKSRKKTKKCSQLSQVILTLHSKQEITVNFKMSAQGVQLFMLKTVY